MELIRIMKLAVRKFSEYYDIKKYRINVGDYVVVHDYALNNYRIKINNKK